jgi:hypothetical protein
MYRADSAAGLPIGSSDYISYYGFNIPLLLQISTSGKSNALFASNYFIESGIQVNILSAQNRDEQSSSISDFGFVVGVGWSAFSLISADFSGQWDVFIRFGFNSSGLITPMLMVRLLMIL